MTTKQHIAMFNLLIRLSELSVQAQRERLADTEKVAAMIKEAKAKFIEEQKTALEA